MSALTSLLARDRVVSVQTIQEAIQQQVVTGGDLEAVLLEMGAAQENVMAAYRAAIYGLLPATRGEVMGVDRQVIRIVPREVAQQHRMVPLMAEDKKLVVAASSPLTVERAEQVEYILGFRLVFRIVTEVRLCAALSHFYGVESSPRMRRLAERLRSKDAGTVPYVKPAKDGKLERGLLRGPESVPPRAAALAPETEPEAPKEIWEEETTNAENVASKAQRELLAQEKPAVVPAPMVGVARVVGITDNSESEEPHRPTMPDLTPHLRTPRLRGPLTAKNTVDELGKADNRDQILQIFFAFARQFFDYTALFVIRGQEACGYASHGNGPETSTLENFAFPLRGSLGRLLAEREMSVVNLDLDPEDAGFVNNLRRDRHQPALLAPVVLRTRVVMVIYGDRDGEDFSVSDFPELSAVLPRVIDALHRIILRRKFSGYETPEPEAREASKASGLVVGPVALKSVRPIQGGYRPSQAPAEVPKRRSGPLGDLGVRGSAPPNVPGESAAARVPRDTRPDGEASEAVKRSRGSAPELEEPFRDNVVSEPPTDLERADSRKNTILDDTAEQNAIRDSLLPNRPLPPVSAAASDAALGAASTAATPAQGATKAKRTRTKAQQGKPITTYSVTSGRTDVIASTPSPKRGTAVAAITGDAESAVRKPTPSGSVPSVIVDMGEPVETLIDDLVQCGPEGDENAVRALLNLGEAALPAVVQRFPGPLWFDRRRPHRRLPLGRDISALARAVIAFGDTAVPYIATLLQAKEPEIRFYATLLASEFHSPRLLNEFYELIFDSDPGTQVLVLDVLKRYVARREAGELLKAVRLDAKVTARPVERRRLATRALGELRDAGSIDLLVELVSSSNAHVATAAHRALVVLTRQDHGDSPRRWAQWAERHRHQHRVEWLIEGLLHPDESLREAAADELKQITQEYHGYHPASPRRDREIAQRKYRNWWEGEGRRRFQD